MDKVQKKVPNLRLKGFTDDWEQHKLGDLGSVQMNKRIFKDQTSESGEVPFFKIGTFGKKPDSFITKKLFDEYKSKYPYPEVGDILISASGSIGRTVVYKGEDAYFQDSNIVWLEHDSRLKNSFLEQFLKRTKWNKIEGSTIKRLYNKDILNKKINLPDQQEQSTIGNFFKQLDFLITLHQRKLDLLQQLKKGLLQKMFADKDQKQPELRFEGFNDDWEQRKFGNISKTKRGLTYKPTDISSTGIRVLRSSNIKKDTFIFSDDDVFVKESAINIPFVENGDILITAANGSTNLVGKHAIIRDIPKNSAVHGGFMLITTSKEYEFLNALMSSNWYKKFIKKYVAGGNGAIGNIRKNDLDNQKIYVPKKDEQEQIGEFFKQLDSLIALHQRKLDRLNSLKKGLLQQMFI